MSATNPAAETLALLRSIDASLKQLLAQSKPAALASSKASCASASSSSASETFACAAATGSSSASASSSSPPHATSARARSIPAVIPADVQTFPSCT